ncbi:MAG TPA: PA0069 family radical SAM protein [Verrucomicrobiae bacterium]|nr:PA0069 family radical SAM protein [Verrucomicrobiae bacterium]
MPAAEPIKGRGASANPTNRFEHVAYERDIDWNPEEDPSPRTQILKDATKTIIAYNNSPDVGFDASINVYRGCEHGCAYCFARPTHEYLGFSAGLDFETKIVIKENAPELLREELSSRTWKPQVLAMSGVTDCYQPLERKLQLTRRCLEVLLEFRNPVCIITKNYLVTRDVDLLAQLAKFDAVVVNVSITTLDATLTPKLEPRAALPKARLEAIRILSEAGVPVGVLAAPMIPGLNDHELPNIIIEAVRNGASFAGYVPLRLPFGLKELFETWIDQHFPEKKEKILNRIRAIRGGKLNDGNFGSRMRGDGIFAEQLAQLFHVACRKAGLKDERPRVSSAHFRRVEKSQLEFF